MIDTTRALRYLTTSRDKAFSDPPTSRSQDAARSWQYAIDKVRQAEQFPIVGDAYDLDNMPIGIGVHITHCCVRHGCKYGDEYCAVAEGVFEQEHSCEACEYDPAPTYQTGRKAIADLIRTKTIVPAVHARNDAEAEQVMLELADVVIATVLAIQAAGEGVTP